MNPGLLPAIASVSIESILITRAGVLESIFGTTSLTGEQWGICLVPGVILLIFGEILTLILRARRPKDQPATVVEAASAAA